LRDTILHCEDFQHCGDSLRGPGLRLPAMPGLVLWPIFWGRSPLCCKKTLKYVLPALWGTGSRNLSHIGLFELSSIARNLAVCPEHIRRAFLLGVPYPKKDALACQCLTWGSAPQLPQLTARFPTMKDFYIVHMKHGTALWGTKPADLLSQLLHFLVSL
jgi:hypothetical protein